MKTNLLKTFLILLNVILISSCHHFSGKLSLSEKEVRKFSTIHESLKRSKGLELANDTDVLIYSNWRYSGLWNNLESWRMSQKLFTNICTDYWKISAQRITVIEHDRAGKLEHFLRNYKGKRLIVYFSSHQTSKSQIVLHDGSHYSTRRFADRLNELKCDTWLIYDTCYADLLKKYLTSEKVSVYYAAPKSQEAYDFRPKGQKPSLNKMSEETAKFIKAAWDIDLKSVSPFGFYLVKAMLEDSYSGVTLDSLISSIVSSNRKMTKITGLGRYPQVYWEDPAGWGELKARQ